MVAKKDREQMSGTDEEGTRVATGETRAPCQHCGTLYIVKPRVGAVPGGFCCSGCEFVHDLLNREGWNRFYDLRSGNTLRPVQGIAFQARDFGWLTEAGKNAEQQADESGVAKTTVGLRGLSCAACLWLVERVFTKDRPGALKAVADVQQSCITLWWEAGRCDVAAYGADLQRFGYELEPSGAVSGAVGSATSSQRDLLTRIGVCGALAMNAMAFSLPRYLGMESGFAFAGLFQMIAAVSATLALAAGGGYFFPRAWRASRLGIIHMDLPISLGLLGAWIGSLAGWLLGLEGLLYFDFVALFPFLMLVGRWLQEAAVERNRRWLGDGGLRLPDVLVVTSSGLAGKRPEDLESGEIFQLPPGDRSPVRAVVESPVAELSLEWINGEAEPKVYAAGAEIPGGAANVARHPLRLRALERHAESLLARLLSAPRTTPESRSPMQGFLKAYLATVVLTALGGYVWWQIFAGFGPALQVAVSVLVVSCPCALGVALPFVEEVVLASLRRRGLFVREGSLWQRLGAVRRLVFDKTGTLTREAPVLEDRGQLTALSPRERQILGGLVHDSRHPVGRGLREALAGDRHAGVFQGSEALSGEIQEAVGKGVWWTEESGTVWSLGRPGWYPGGATTDSSPTGARVVFARDGAPVVNLNFQEALRPDAGEELRLLRRRGYRLAILSGDAQSRVTDMGQRLELEGAEILGDLSPQAKADWIMAHDARSVLYVGDGANDSLAFDVAAISGTPVAGGGVLDTKCDFYFLGEGLRAIRWLLDASRRRRRTVRWVVGFALGYNATVVAVCLAGHMNPLLAAVLMPLSSLATLGLASRAG